MANKSLKQRMGVFQFYLCCIGVVLAVGYGGFRYGHHLTEQQMQRIDGLQQTVSELNKQNNDLVRQQHIIGVELEIEKQANRKSQEDLQQSFADNQQIRNELSFYQKVMAPELSDNGFVIDSVNIQSTLTSRRFQYALVLLQQDKRKRQVKGSVSVRIRGIRDGKVEEINLLDLQPKPQDRQGFSFRFFETLTGEFTLPDGFAPARIIVKASIVGARGDDAHPTKEFDWQDIVDQTSDD